MRSGIRRALGIVVGGVVEATALLCISAVPQVRGQDSLDPHLDARPQVISRSVASVPLAGNHAGAPVALPPAELVRFDNPSRSAILRHEIEAALDPGAHRLEAVDHVTVAFDGQVATDQAWPFLLWKDLQVTGVETGGSPLRFEVKEGVNPRDFWHRPPYAEIDAFSNAREIRVWGTDRWAVWPETLRISVHYAGALYDTLQPPKAAYARSFETTAGLIEERGAFLSFGSFWIPTRPNEVFTFRSAARVPETWRAVSQGALISETVSASGPETPGDQGASGRHTDVWDCPQPMEEVYLVAGPWILHQRDHHGVMAQTFTYPETDSSLYNRYLDGTGDYLDLYGRLIGPYPFAKFALVENFWQTGFGMPSFTLLGDRVIRLPFILGTSYGHEILHNWWGNGVFVDASTGNWCEGLTTYGADYLYKAQEGPEAARQYRLNALAGYLDYVSEAEEMPLSDFRERHDFSTQAVGYSKSMMVIHQLHRRAGEQRFWESLQDFYARNLWRRADWSDLLRCFRHIPGIDPDAFRRQWIERSGAPRIDLGEVAVRPEGSRWRVRATITQEPGPGAGSGAAAAEFDAYDLLVPLRLSFVTEAGSIADSTWLVPLRERSLAWSEVVDRRPSLLEVDPDFEMMRRIHRAEIPPTLSRVLGADSVTIVIASGLGTELEQSYLDLANQWAQGQPADILLETDVKPGWVPPGSVWYLGLGPAAQELLRRLPEVQAQSRGGAWMIADGEFPGTSNVILVGSVPENPSAAWAVVAVGSSSDVPVVGGKLPHYGRYSYLVFEGGTNVGKGVWSEVDSPLRVALAAK